MELHVNAIKASKLPNKEFLGHLDTYLALQVTGESSFQKTCVIENSQNPIWNQEFHFQLKNYEQQKLICSVQAKSVSEDICLGTIEIPLIQFKIGEIVDKCYKLVISPDLKAESTVRIVIQVAPIGHPAFHPYSVIPPVYGDYVFPQIYEDFIQYQIYGDFAQPQIYGDYVQPEIYGDYVQPQIYGDFVFPQFQQQINPQMCSNNK